MRLGQLKGTVSKCNLNFDIFMRENHPCVRMAFRARPTMPAYHWSAFSLQDWDMFEGASEGRSTT